MCSKPIFSSKFARGLLELQNVCCSKRQKLLNVAEHNRERPTLLGRDPRWFDSCKRPLSLCILGGRLRDVPTVLTYDLFLSASF